MNVCNVLQSEILWFSIPNHKNSNPKWYHKYDNYIFTISNFLCKPYIADHKFEKHLFDIWLSNIITLFFYGVPLAIVLYIYLSHPASAKLSAVMELTMQKHLRNLLWFFCIYSQYLQLYITDQYKAWLYQFKCFF